MRILAVLVALAFPLLAQAQSRTVLPEELGLTVEVEASDYTPFVREMIILNIHGIYRRHITRESMEQPDLDGFSWTQLGEDIWREERINGEKVKTMTRRMAIYPNRAGELRIGAFAHRLTLTDEQDEWFDHAILSEPLTITVAPAPEDHSWWFPVRDLRISDQWSNAPDQLKRGEGVLRVIRLEAVGVTPEMMPPMPELRSPSGIVFPHPDKRLVELSPEGPITYAFWRWTIRPGNDTSAVVEPLKLEYFDTRRRQAYEVDITAQRVAYGDVIPKAPPPNDGALAQEAARLPGWPLVLLGICVFAGGLWAAVSGWRWSGTAAVQRFALLDPLTRQILRAARDGDAGKVRHHAAGLLARDGASAERLKLLAELDHVLFDPRSPPMDLLSFARRFANARPDASASDIPRIPRMQQGST
ncbi:MAG: hypothetical protein AAF999_12270 [Pseudomonadota bacterium]